MGCLPQQTTSNLDVNLVKLISNVVCDTLNKVQNNALIVKERNVVNSNVQGVPSNNIDQLSRNLQSCHISNEFQSFSLGDISKIIPNFDGEGDLQPLDFLQFLESSIEINKVKFDSLKIILSRAFKNSAKIWWDAFSHLFHEYNDFKFEFIEQFWNLKKQRRIKDRLECDQYKSGLFVDHFNFGSL
ncbi:hypothetical protein HHI36_014964 [Cryptolaemus montrouzieri]|uniref:Retrotransposon gag domain-containing protein n=1 Tax=Cryptolaemus montrouzieri TaxID=559131 RepID=A0ABD2N4Q0_9CUCU